MTYLEIRSVLRALELPPNLLMLIKTGQLHATIERAEREMAEMNDALDAWEAANPEAAAVTPWANSRKAWKEAGRPSPPWYELLTACGTRTVTSKELEDTYPEFNNMHWHRVKQDEDRRKAYHRQRHAARQNARWKREARAREAQAQAEAHQ